MNLSRRGFLRRAPIAVPFLAAASATVVAGLSRDRALEIAEKMVRPPMLVVLKEEPASIMPGFITYVSNADESRAFMAAFNAAQETVGWSRA